MNNYEAQKKEIAEKTLDVIKSVFESALEDREIYSHSSLASSRKRTEYLELTIHEPICASITYSDENGKKQTIYITRGDTTTCHDFLIASYRSPIGRLAALDIGDNEYVELPKQQIECTLLQKNEFFPFKPENIWDAEAIMFFENKVFFQEPSLRKLKATYINNEIRIDQQSIDKIVIQSFEKQQKLKKEIIDSMNLRDKPILDKIQDEIFRELPNKQLVIMGPPGTGKTTTLIKKLGKNLDEKYSQLEDKSWYMFTPTELLKSYLKEAFNREGIPAPDNNVFIWHNFIQPVAREVIKILNTCNSKGFILTDKEYLQKIESAYLKDIYIVFINYVLKYYSVRFSKLVNDTIYKIDNIKNEILNCNLPYISKIISNFDLTKIKKIEKFNNRLEAISHLINCISDLNNDLISMIKQLNNEPHLGYSQDIQKFAYNKLQEMAKLMQNLANTINADIFIEKIKYAYAYFKKEFKTKYYIDDSDNKNISHNELDIIVLAYLQFYNWFAQRNMLSKKKVINDGIEKLHRAQIFVDEITDFSPIQIRIMSQLFSDSNKTFVGAGDFGQRLTNNGISSITDLQWAIPSVLIRKIEIPYRQSKQLYELSQKIINNYNENFKQPRYLDTNGLYPTVGFNLDSYDKKAYWLTKRICEIEHQVKKLPSIAILVNKENEIKPLALAMNKYLLEFNIQVDACLEGKILGYKNNIRIFSIDYIKGL